MTEDSIQISPEERITNIINWLQELIFSPAFPGRQKQVREAIVDLHRLWPQYRDGELLWIVDGREVPAP